MKWLFFFFVQRMEISQHCRSSTWECSSKFQKCQGENFPFIWTLMIVFSPGLISSSYGQAVLTHWFGCQIVSRTRDALICCSGGIMAGDEERKKWHVGKFQKTGNRSGGGWFASGADRMTAFALHKSNGGKHLIADFWKTCDLRRPNAKQSFSSNCKVDPKTQIVEHILTWAKHKRVCGHLELHRYTRLLYRWNFPSLLPMRESQQEHLREISWQASGLSYTGATPHLSDLGNSTAVENTSDPDILLMRYFACERASGLPRWWLTDKNVPPPRSGKQNTTSCCDTWTFRKLNSLDEEGPDVCHFCVFAYLHSLMCWRVQDMSCRVCARLRSRRFLGSCWEALCGKWRW